LIKGILDPLFTDGYKKSSFSEFSPGKWNILMQDTIKFRNSLEKSIDLKNGLTLELWDKSRSMVGDRWKITVIAQVDIPLEKAFLETNTSETANFDEMKKALGESVRFEKKMERFFIDEKEKDNITREILDSLVESLFPYLSHPQFCRRFIIMEFARAKQKKLLSKQQQQQKEKNG
jgi:hypothetical protein